VSCSSGSVHTSLAELSKSSMEAVRHQPSTSHVSYHKAQCSVRVCLYCTRRILKTTSRNMASVPRVHQQHATTVVHWRHDVMSAILRLENCIEEVSHWMSANRLKLNVDKTELFWAWSHQGLALLWSTGPYLQLGTETVTASDQVRVVGVTLTSDLCLDKHVASICATCFYWLRQLRRVLNVHVMLSQRLRWSTLL